MMPLGLPPQIQTVALVCIGNYIIAHGGEEFGSSYVSNHSESGRIHLLEFVCRRLRTSNTVYLISTWRACITILDAL